MKVSRAVTTERFSDRTRSLLTLVNLHWAGVILLSVVSLILLGQMWLAWRAQSRDSADALSQEVAAMRVAELQAKPLQGLDAKLSTATVDADRFYDRRLPYAYSQVAGELGALAKRNGLKLARVQYAQSPMLDGTSAALTEVRMDASLSGDYRGLVQYVNALERDRMFFLIRGVTLTGQQSGTVGLRIGLTTYLRAPLAAEGSPVASIQEPVTRGGAGQ